MFRRLYHFLKEFVKWQFTEKINLFSDRCDIYRYTLIYRIIGIISSNNIPERNKMLVGQDRLLGIRSFH